VRDSPGEAGQVLPLELGGGPVLDGDGIAHDTKDHPELIFMVRILRESAYVGGVSEGMGEVVHECVYE
jgi:hypothetical protein